MVKCENRKYQPAKIRIAKSDNAKFNNAKMQNFDNATTPYAEKKFKNAKI